MDLFAGAKVGFKENNDTSEFELVLDNYCDNITFVIAD